MQLLSGTDNTFLVVALIMGAMAVISLTQLLSGSGLGGPRARNLFLGVKLRLEEGGKEQVAWIRALDAQSLLLVSPKHLKKGESLRVNLSALPDYPKDEAAQWVEAEVKRVRSLGGDPATFEVQVRLKRLEAPLRAAFSQVIRHLAAHGSLKHA